MANFFSDLLTSPIITVLLFGFYVKDMFVAWRLDSLGWLLCFVIELVIVLVVLSFAAFVYRRTRRIISSFRKPVHETER